MVIFSRPLYDGMPRSSRPWPRTILVEVEFTYPHWTLIYDDGTHVVCRGRHEMEEVNPLLTSTNINAYYLCSKESKRG